MSTHNSTCFWIEMSCYYFFRFFRVSISKQKKQDVKAHPKKIVTKPSRYTWALHNRSGCRRTRQDLQLGMKTGRGPRTGTGTAFKSTRRTLWPRPIAIAVRAAVSPLVSLLHDADAGAREPHASPKPRRAFRSPFNSRPASVQPRRRRVRARRTRRRASTSIVFLFLFFIRARRRIVRAPPPTPR